MKSTPKPASPPLEILIAEDSPTQALQLERALQKHGYHVTKAANGRLALEAARHRKPTLIISDVIMPEMDGYELCREVKSDASLADTPVILVTSLSDPQDVIRGLECRADNFILKPFEELHLLNRVRFVLANHDLHQTERAGMGVEIFFNGNNQFITADRLQILSLLLSTYEAAMQRNNELNLAQENFRDLNSSLEVANKELEDFSNSVSRDLHGPIRGIGEYSQILLKECEPLLSERQWRLLRYICGTAERMEQLIEDLLNLSRLGRQALAVTREQGRPGRTPT